MGHAGADQVVVDSTEDQLADQAHDALARLLRISGQPLMTRVHRWLRSMPQYEVGHLRRVKAIEDDLASFPAVGLAGSAYRGVGVPDCVRQGRDAAVAILERLKGAEHAV